MGEDQEGGELDRIFMVASHRIRRKIIESIAEKGPRSFTELMDDAGVSDTGTMTFHLKKMMGFIRKNEKGFYELTELGWRAYEVIRGAVGKSGEESHRERQAEKPSAGYGKPEDQGLPVVIEDMIRLVVDREMLERIRSQGRRLIISDIITVEVRDDVDPALFDEVVERIRDVITLRVPRNLLPIAQLKCRDVLIITSRDRGDRGGFAATLGSLAASIPSLVSSVISSVAESLASVLRSMGDRVTEHREGLVLKESFTGVRSISIDVSGGVVRVSHGVGGDVAVSIYERGKCKHDLDLNDGVLFIDISGCEASIEIPERELESVELDASGGYIEIGIARGVRKLAGDLSGCIAAITLGDVASSDIDLKVRGGKTSIDISYREFAGESSLRLDVSGGMIDLRARVPPAVRVESSVSRTGGLFRIDIDEKLTRIENPKGILRVRTDIVGGLANLSFRPGNSG